MSHPAFIEGLESRLFLSAAPKVLAVIADNRGEVTITLSRTVTGISKNSVKLFTVADNLRQPASVKYNVSSFRITIKANLGSNTAYRVRMDSKVIASLDGKRLDGEFTGILPSGDGHPGGNFAFQTRKDKSLTPRARMSTTDGVITLRLRKDIAPNTVNNFVNYANSGRYDSTFWTRSESGFVIQGGSLQVTGTGATASDIVATTTDAPIADENPGGISNTLGTLSFAKGGANTATNQIFINLGDNSSLDSTSNSGGFTVFAQITSGLAAAQTTNARATADLSTQIGSIDPFTGVSNVPVTNKTQAESTLVPSADLIIIRRVALLNKIAPVT